MLVFWLLIVSFFQFSSSRPRAGNYDFLIFTQSWPPTSCYEWEEKSPSHHCNMLPSQDSDEWSIHGLWPTKNKTLGPFYCNNSLHFDMSALEKLRNELEIKWIDVHKGCKPHEFWRHEWEKHGTCSVDLVPTNTEAKYFKKGLDLYDSYDMKHVLAKANILPNQTYLLQDYLNGVKKVLGINAYVECLKNSKHNQILISELRICFDRDFQLMNCDGMADFPSNCHSSDKIFYPATVPDRSTLPKVIQV